VPDAALLSGAGVAALALVDPGVDVVAEPDFALGEVDDGCRELGAAGELMDALAADAEQFTDLMHTDQPRRPPGEPYQRL
jgi:hypothetical protein